MLYDIDLFNHPCISNITLQQTITTVSSRLTQYMREYQKATLIEGHLIVFNLAKCIRCRFSQIMQFLLNFKDQIINGPKLALHIFFAFNTWINMQSCIIQFINELSWIMLEYFNARVNTTFFSQEQQIIFSQFIKELLRRMYFVHFVQCNFPENPFSTILRLSKIINYYQTFCNFSNSFAINHLR